MMSGINMDLYVKDELEFDVRSRGKKPQGHVASLRKQLREALAAGEAMSGVSLSDMAAEVELCHEKYIELRDVAEGLQSAPSTSRAKRLRNLETQAGTTEMETALASLRGQVAARLQDPPISQPHPPEVSSRPSTLEVDNKPNQAAPLMAFSGMEAACYHKLPNPLTDIIQLLPVMDGLDADKLLSCLLYTSRCV